MIALGAHAEAFEVALHTEGVDRNGSPCQDLSIAGRVALHTEGVDRNLSAAALSAAALVALHTEGVDRNTNGRKSNENQVCRPPHGGRG